MNLKTIFRAVICIILCSQVTHSSNILGVFTSHSKSHLIVYMSVVSELVKKGHNVTVVTTIPIKLSSPNLRHIKLEGNEYHDIIKKLLNSDSNWSHFSNFFGSLGQLLKAGDIALKDSKMQEFLLEKDNKFDLLLLGYFFNDYQIGLGAHFKCPIALIWTGQPFGIVNELFGNPSEITHIPNLFLPKNDNKQMNFFERTLNVIFSIIEKIAFFFLDKQMRGYYEDNFPISKYPDYDEVKKNITLLLCNHHFSEGPIRANVPAIIEIGGIQIKPKPDPLPKDLKIFLESSTKEGAIFFSLGSNVQSSYLPIDTVTTIYKVLSTLRQKVVWKWEDDIKPGNSSNIFFGKWLPQDDILAHPNIRLFITHGGKGSVVEAKYHGVPMIGLPVFADQPMNIRMLETSGYGRGLVLKSLDAETFRATILEVIENPKYRENIQKYSKLYRDRPLTARETSTFWIEYIIRNNGAFHLQSSAVHLTKIEYNGIDVAAFLIIVIYVVWKIFKFILVFLWRKITCQKKGLLNKNKDKKQKKL